MVDSPLKALLVAFFPPSLTLLASTRFTAIGRDRCEGATTAAGDGTQKGIAACGSEFEDFLPTMAKKLVGEALIEELCGGFQLLMDPHKGLITFKSLKRNATLMGLDGMSDNELMGMMTKGDLDGDGALDQTEFCMLMFRLSPELMDESWRVADEALNRELRQNQQQECRKRGYRSY